METTPPRPTNRVARHLRPRRHAGRLRRTGKAAGAVLVAVVVAAVLTVAFGPSRVLEPPAATVSSDRGVGASHPTPAPAGVSARETVPLRHIRPDPRRRAPPTAAMRWAGILRTLNARREQAWRRGAPELLRGVYLPQSLARRDDERTLTAYLDRGLRVRGVRLGFVRLRVVTRRPRFVRLEVVDRLGAMTAVTSRGMQLRLPRDQATRHCIVLRRLERRWRIAAVRAA